MGESSRLVRRNMSASLADGTGWALMFGLGDSYFSAFALALGFPGVTSGLLGAVPQILGAIVQTAGPRMVAWLGSHKRWVVITATVQAGNLLVPVAGAIAGSMPGWLLFLTVSVHHAAGMAGGAAWSTWVGSWVPARVKHRWFGIRQRHLQAMVLTGFLLGAIVLSLVTGGVPPAEFGDNRVLLWGFAGLFAMALAARVLSVYYLTRQAEPTPMPASQRRVPLLTIASRLMHAQRGSVMATDGRLLVAVFGITFASNIGQPFIVPYALDQLKISYWWFAAVIGAAIAGRALTLSILGNFARTRGSHVLLLIGAVMLVPGLGVMTLFNHPAWITAIQLQSGVAWACIELATFLMFLEHLRDDERTSWISFYYLGNTIALVLGSMLGGLLIARLGSDQQAYEVVFWIATGLRALALILVVRVLTAINAPDAAAAAARGRERSQRSE